jgi:hypothetical protein
MDDVCKYIPRVRWAKISILPAAWPFSACSFGWWLMASAGLF